MDVNGQSIGCNHFNKLRPSYATLVIPDFKNHPVAIFMDSFFMNKANNANVHVEKYLQDTFTRHQEVWDNESNREMAINMFIAIGTNLLLSNKRGNSFLAQATVILENYDGIGIISTLNSRVTATKMRDLLGSSAKHRDELKFFRKRTSCKCLKDMHLEVRKVSPKLGTCYHCKEEKGRALLMVCSSCRIAHYCSRQCQVANWSGHKRECNIFRLRNNWQRKGETE